jgi:release factor glutamine methyltransferase
VTLRELTSRAGARLAAAGIAAPEAELDAQLLAAQVLGYDRTQLITSWRDPAPSRFPAAFERLIQRRELREPISQILGVREFWGLEFEVTRDVLTPRPETEGLIEAVREHARDAEVIEEVGTGSGCVAVALAVELPRARLIAVDISAPALAVARRNAGRHGVANRIAFVQGDLSSCASCDLDVIVSNPPYVPVGQRAALSPEVRDYEPPEALFAGEDGLDVIRALISGVARGAGHWLIFECGIDQDTAIREMIAREPRLSLVEIRPDLAGIPRVVVARRTTHA